MPPCAYQRSQRCTVWRVTPYLPATSVTGRPSMTSRTALWRCSTTPSSISMAAALPRRRPSRSSIRGRVGAGCSAQGVTHLPEPVSPVYRSRVSGLEPICRSQCGKHLPGPHTHVSCKFRNFFATLVFWSGCRRGKTPANRHNALVAQWIEHRFPKPGVAGSIPAGGTTRWSSSCFEGGSAACASGLSALTDSCEASPVAADRACLTVL